MPINSPATPKPARLLLNSWTFTWSLAGILMVLLSWKKIGSYDLGFHLKIGEWIWKNHAFPHQDLLTQMNWDYLDPHCLFQALLFKLNQWGGFPLISYALTLILITLFSLIGLRLRGTRSPSVLCFLLFLAVLFLTERRFLPRPEILSWLFLNWNLWVLEDPRRDRKWLWTLLLVQWLWIWTEGLFVLGFLVQALFWFGKGLEQKGWDKELAKVFGLGFCLSFLNPNGWNGVLFPAVLWQRLQDPLYQSSISEFLSPLKVLSTQNLHYDLHLHLFLFLVLFLLVLLGTFWTWSHRSITELLLVGTFSFLAWTSVRNIPLFTWVALPILARVYRDFEIRPLAFLFRNRWAPWAGILLVLFLCFRVVTNAFYMNERRLDRFGVGLDPERLPIAAADFLRENHLEGRMLNSMDWGGWLAWENAGQPYIDGRLEVPSRNFFQGYLESFRPDGLPPLLGKVHPDLIVMEYNTAGSWVQQLRALSDWRLVYFDENSAIYLHQGYSPQVPVLDFAQWMVKKGLTPASETDLVQQVNGSVPQGLFKVHEYPMGLGSEGLFALSLGEYSAAESLFAEQLRIAGSGYDEILFNLGVSSLHLKQWTAGKACLQRVLQLDPGNLQAQRMLQSLP